MSWPRFEQSISRIGVLSVMAARVRERDDYSQQWEGSVLFQTINDKYVLFWVRQNIFDSHRSTNFNTIQGNTGLNRVLRTSTSRSKFSSPISTTSNPLPQNFVSVVLIPLINCIGNFLLKLVKCPVLQWTHQILCFKAQKYCAKCVDSDHSQHWTNLDISWRKDEIRIIFETKLFIFLKSLHAPSPPLTILICHHERASPSDWECQN
jgi:hypothetical protein